MQIQIVSIEDLSLNPNNPRIIKDSKYKKLVKSIRDFPKMLEIRPIVVDEEGMVLGGNMRLKACKEAGLERIPVIYAEDLTEEQKKEFIIKDNASFGEWDWEILKTEWNLEEVEEWSIDIPSYVGFDDINLDPLFNSEEDFSTNTEEAETPLKQLTFNLNEEDFEKCTKILKKVNKDMNVALLQIINESGYEG